ncbi:hypothetical protein [Flavobacterium sp.]|uniref:hypothetical protein n=1 Tax=Flavobacterium sp. TaxID=239 RepID=UPI0026085B14|nr:hypothetical protein [Flavobacterium sp.]MDG2431797.1 hypothetical protein [Flavobacterium sp.]
MKSKLTTLFFLFLCSFAFSQQLTYKKGRVFNDNNVKLTNSQVKELLSDKPELLASYSAGQTKASVGGFLLGFGTGFVLVDLATGLSQDKVYPSALTFIGLASAAISIPVIIGHSKKINKAIDGYNEAISPNKVGFHIEKINILSNKNGIGMQLSF